MMKLKTLLILGITGIIFVTAFTACTQPDGASGTDNPGKPAQDFTALNTAIADAEAAKRGVKPAASEVEVPETMKWVTVPVWENFDAAIEKAKGSLDATTQSAVDAAAIVLKAATDAFNEAKKDGTKPLLHNQGQIDKLLQEANEAMLGVKISDNGEDVAKDHKWVTAEENSALASAIAAAENHYGDIDNAHDGLSAALPVFNNAKKSGTLNPRELTITGLKVADGTTVTVSMYESFITGDEAAAATGSAVKQNGTVKVTLYQWAGKDAYYWAGAGSYLAVVETPATYINNQPIAFSNVAASASQTTDFSKFTPFVYQYRPSNFIFKTGAIPASGIKMDDWCVKMSARTTVTETVPGKNYNDLLAEGVDLPLPLYRNERLTQKFTGDDILFANTQIFSEFKLFGGGSPRLQLGAISGNITLANVGSPAPRVFLKAGAEGGASNSQWWSDRTELVPSSGSYANISWLIPIFRDTGFFASPDAKFVLIVQPGGNADEFEIKVPVSPPISINNENTSGVRLGTVSIKTVTLSGTITVTRGNANAQVPVPYVQIVAAETVKDSSGWVIGDWIGTVDLENPAANAPWSLVLRPSDTTATVALIVYGFQDSQRSVKLFYKERTEETEIIKVTQVPTTITINLGNLSNDYDPPSDPGLIAPLPNNTWQNGTITVAKGVVWYSMDVTAKKDDKGNDIYYYIWWNELVTPNTPPNNPPPKTGDGDGTKNLDIEVHVWDENGNVIKTTNGVLNSEVSWAQNTNQIDLRSSSVNKLFIRVRASSFAGPDKTGTYAIVYNTSGDRLLASN